MLDLKQILIPTDFGESALQATQYGLEFARQFGAQLTLLHVIEDPVVYVPFFESYPLPSRQEFEEYAQTRLENWVQPEDQEGLDLQTRWLHGTPFVEIVRSARDLQTDLIIVGNRGPHASPHSLLGSVAEKVVRKAPCPVLTVRPGGHDFVHPLISTDSEE